ncbi:hypothetical protein FEP87_05430 [Burkholderia multivorans]|nr:hypothetical protein [Burkholderia multivorans]
MAIRPRGRNPRADLVVIVAPYELVCPAFDLHVHVLARQISDRIVEALHPRVIVDRLQQPPQTVILEELGLDRRLSLRIQEDLPPVGELCRPAASGFQSAHRVVFERLHDAAVQPVRHEPTAGRTVIPRLSSIEVGFAVEAPHRVVAEPILPAIFVTQHHDLSEPVPAILE